MHIGSRLLFVCLPSSALTFRPNFACSSFLCTPWACVHPRIAASSRPPHLQKRPCKKTGTLHRNTEGNYILTVSPKCLTML